MPADKQTQDNRLDAPVAALRPLGLVTRWMVVAWFLATVAIAAAGSEVRPLKLANWLRNRDAGAANAAHKPGGVELALNFPGENRFSLPVADSWRGWESLEIELSFDEPPPADLDVWVYTKDWDFLWRHVRFQHPHVQDGRMTLSVPLAGDQTVAWQPVGHRRPWHCLTPERIRVLGLKFEREGVQPFTGNARVRGVRLVGRSPQTPLEIRRFNLTPTSLRVGETCEVTFEIPRFEGNPFDRGELAVDATISRPDGRNERISGFYHEGFVLRPVGLQDELLPAGLPQFKLRYTPRTPGRHRLAISVVNGERRLDIPPVDVEVLPAAADYRGFVRVDANDPNYLAYENGMFFPGIGVNTRSPSDTRHDAMVPHNLWRDEGINFYKRVFPVYQRAGINVAEVWLSSWWLALEWIPDAPGNHGVGHFNQRRSFLLDRLLELAEKHGIQLILVINNHGKFSTFCDQEWARNPYNRANGGFLDHNETYFTDKDARQWFKYQADYLVARWGHSPNVLSWKLFSEINLTGASHHFYRTPAMINWHREMAEYFHAIDIYDHPVTTHWSSNYTVINEPIGSLKALDILTTDAYTNNYGNTAQFMQYLEGTSDYAESMGKPVVVTEFGGHPMGDSFGVLQRQLRLANWFGFFGKTAILPMMWWFAIVDEEDYYDEFAAISAFMHGEDPRGMRRHSMTLPEKGVKLELLKGRDRMLLWGYDVAYFHSAVEAERPPVERGMKLSVEGLRPGEYLVEHWNCSTGKVVLQDSLAVEADGKGLLSLPEFAGDFAIKILPASHRRRR